MEESQGLRIDRTGPLTIRRAAVTKTTIPRRIRRSDQLATHKSAVKRHRQSLKRHARNQAIKARLRTTIKKVRSAIEQKDSEAARTALSVASQALDKAVTQGVLHRNSASRRISRLTVQVHQLTAR